ncbi:hypothetical protein TBLA_0E02130 [Henningerozyma blattae CBS 6284]|uniref:FUN14 domain-containing protein n=1 Tax=Henningerozyma blattae (strain ATCC 34711 / CBS 6284 / DSM 70876 / NBRC 10599 / NRRL Y-10934 / UCD 77-7) TaxID=1071380 RepID=I2H4G4_HENB6|nr:hypothetical protein TBLA_0E02130 [Tetrapisispora blattae CBS 6284]CCH61266.1 hypothetical protein TBLA_0E02130 [Tetrapisispora blattae CBS 6284]
MPISWSNLCLVPKTSFVVGLNSITKRSLIIPSSSIIFQSKLICPNIFFKKQSKNHNNKNRILLLTSSVSFSWYILYHTPVLNDDLKNSMEEKEIDSFLDNQEYRHQKYNQLCFGSIFGILLGLIFKKISHGLIYLGISTSLIFRWLNSRGFINNKAIRNYLGDTMKINIKQNWNWIFRAGWFKIPFILTFVMTVYNI